MRAQKYKLWHYDIESFFYLEKSKSSWMMSEVHLMDSYKISCKF